MSLLQLKQWHMAKPEDLKKIKKHKIAAINSCAKKRAGPTVICEFEKDLRQDKV